MPTNVVSDKPFWKRSQFYSLLITLVTFLGLQFPSWDTKIKVVVQLIQIVATFIGVDQMTRSVDPKDLPADVVFTERDGTTPAPR